MIMETKGRILLAEDDDHLRELVKDALEEEDYQVTDCMNGQEAIDLFDKNKFDICLLDIMMPVKDGFTVAKKIIDGHHGKIDVHSLPGIGTEFKIELPLK